MLTQVLWYPIVERQLDVQYPELRSGRGAPVTDTRTLSRYARATSDGRAHPVS